MNIYSKKQTWKLLLFFFATAIGLSSLLYTHRLVKKLEREELKKMELLAEATRLLASTVSSDTDINFLVGIIQNNETVPVILTDQQDNILSYRNLDTIRVKNKSYLQRQLVLMKNQHPPIEIDLGENNKNFIYYKDSIILNQLFLYPYIQLFVIILFILISYYAFSVSRKAEQNQVWVGLSKETAHQLGTPTSSLIAWVELLRLKIVDQQLIAEMEKDVGRLQKITERFSKIGSKTVLRQTNLNEVLENVKAYLSSRLSTHVLFTLDLPPEPVIIPANGALLEWVIENTCKNAYDAISSQGTILVTLKKNKHQVVIDITDNGKGIPKSKFKTIFKPGYTTKASGWGLGLSLSKRIIETYHSGRIFVQSSEPGKGTTIRILLKSPV